MAKKSDKYAGMGDMFVQQEIDEKTATFNAARIQIEEEIKSNKENINYADPNDAKETENDVRFLERKLETLRKEYEQEIDLLKSKQK